MTTDRPAYVPASERRCPTCDLLIARPMPATNADLAAENARLRQRAENADYWHASRNALIDRVRAVIGGRGDVLAGEDLIDAALRLLAKAEQERDEAQRAWWAFADRLIPLGVLGITYDRADIAERACRWIISLREQGQTQARVIGQYTSERDEARTERDAIAATLERLREDAAILAEYCKANARDEVYLTATRVLLHVRRAALAAHKAPPTAPSATQTDEAPPTHPEAADVPQAVQDDPGGIQGVSGEVLPEWERKLIEAQVAADWTAKDGRSNSSDLFKQLCAEVERLIRSDAFALIGGRADTTARLIMAQLAHLHGLAPRHPKAEGSPGVDPDYEYVTTPCQGWPPCAPEGSGWEPVDGKVTATRVNHGGEHHWRRRRMHSDGTTTWTAKEARDGAQ